MSHALPARERRASWFELVGSDTARSEEPGSDAMADDARSSSPLDVLRDDLRAPAVALLVTWTGAVVLLWAALVGAVLGAAVAVGALDGSRVRALFTMRGAPGLRPWHVADGIVVGAGGAVAAVAHQVFGSPLAVVACIGIGASMALAIIVWRVRHEAGLLRMTGARRPTMGELRLLAAAAQMAGAPLSGTDTPSVLVTDSRSPAIRAHVRHVVVTTSLLERLDGPELAAFVCHARHHVDSGAALRRAFVAACAWPILLLDAAGTRLGGRGPGRGVGRVVAGIVLWPVKPLVALVAWSSRGRAMLDETEADEHVRRAGLGAELAAALRSLSTAEAGGGTFDGIWTRSRPPMALRLEALEPARPLDGFFGGRAAPIAESGRGGRVALAGAGAVFLVALGGATAGGHGAARYDGEVTTASSFAVAYLDDLFSAPRLHAVVRDSVAPSRVQVASAHAGTSPLATMAALTNGLPTVSRAVALGCRTASDRGAAGPASVAVNVRWDYRVAGSWHSMTTTATVPVGVVAGRWRPLDVPTVRLTAAPGAPAGVFGSCTP